MNTDTMAKISSQKGKRKWLRTAVISLICLLLLANLAGGTYVFIYIIVSKDKDVGGMALELGPAVVIEEIHMTSHDGLDLVGFYLKNEQPSGKLAVLVHGYTNDHTTMAAFAKYYYEDGFNIFMGDCRGHGKSEGRYVGMGWLDRLDYMQWLDLLLQRESEEVQVVLHGISMGGATVVAMSGEGLPVQVKAIIEDCGFDSVYNEFLYQVGKRVGVLSVPFLGVAGMESKLLAGYGFHEADIAAQAAKSQTPIFVIHGASDSFTPAEMAHAIYDAAPEPKELWIVPEAEHGEAFYNQPDAYFERVREFYNKYMTS